MIFNRNQQQNLERLENVLISDKQFSPKQVEKVLKSDAYNLLSNYGNITPENLNVSIELQKDGTYIFSIKATCERLKIFGSLPELY